MYMEKWKVVIIAIACIVGVLYSAPNMMDSRTVDWLQQHTPSFFPNKTVNLGLDLRGGSHLLLEVDTKSVIAEQMQSLTDMIRAAFRGSNMGDEKIKYSGLSANQDSVSFKLLDPAQIEKAQKILRKLDQSMNFDIAEDGSVTASMREEAVAERYKTTMDQSIEIVRRRVDETGTREPSIQKQGDNRILVQLPGVDDPQRIKNLLGQTAKLTFRLVDETANPVDGRAPPGTEILRSTDDGRSYVIQKRTMVSGDTLIDAQPSFQEGMPVVSFKFNSQGGQKFAEATKKNVGHLFAIVLDDKVISAPVIREPITGGSGVISGNFTVQSAQDLALLLRAGALPAPIKVLEERTVGPGLGADSIKAGAMASLLGFGLVVVYFVFSYGLFGIFADVALLFNIALIFAILSILQATLTLPGIAGIVLTIGTALDANVLVYERIREEMRLGRSVIASIDAGFNHALSAIIDANVTTLIAAFILFSFGSGPIKGFAVTLTIGILTSMFSALMTTRLIIALWVKFAKPKTIPL